MFRPREMDELHTPAELLIPTAKKYNGVTTLVYPESGEPIFVNFKSKGGAESVVNGVYTVIKTGEVKTWWRPDITSDCRIKVKSDVYEIKGDPENVELQNKYLIMKVEKIGRNSHGKDKTRV